ncbi:MAG TPA: D-alanine--D-alanine ligase [Leptospiraceae bacterium]|nr:D-alanine--D-alanine ligase [Leptospiraceae bacterium]HNF23679.1 D-alanine--D-alanine ligase [Leptospiraceae bacterium]HNN03084.1 D-alanine--D-alanine ligase [Leptospiraceae bacterium]
MKSVSVIFGGVSTEHNISLRTAKFIYETLDRTKFKVRPVYISRAGEWLIPEEYETAFPEVSTDDEFEELFRKSVHLKSSVFPLKKSFGSDIAFLGLHGGQGEDGTVQAVLHSEGIRHTGSGTAASALAMHKDKSNRVFRDAGFSVAPFFLVKKKEWEADFVRVLDSIDFPYPVFAKPNAGGSSVNTSKILNREELVQFLKRVFTEENEIIVQKCISGIEVSCAVLEINGDLHSFYPTEVVPKSEFFDFKAKYTKGGSEEITPARISKEITELVRQSAAYAHFVLGCSGYSRTDFIIENKIPYILETNTLPGMTETSLLPQQAAYEGYSMKQILTWILEVLV